MQISCEDDIGQYQLIFHWFWNIYKSRSLLTFEADKDMILMQYSNLVMPILFFARICAHDLNEIQLCKAIECKFQAGEQLNLQGINNGKLHLETLTMYEDESFKLLCSVNFTIAGLFCSNHMHVFCSSWETDKYTNVTIALFNLS